MFEFKEELTKEFVLSKITQEDIFMKYLGIYPNETDYFRNPLRTDTHPDCKFYRDSRGMLKFKDFAYQMNIDCFNVIKIIDKNIVTWNDVLQKIAKDFDIYNKEIDYSIKSDWEKAIRTTSKLFSSIRIKRKEFSREEIDWWWEQGIHKEILDKYKVSSLQTVWLNDNVIYGYKKHDFGFAQHFGEYNYKCYFPLRKQWKFLQNLPQTILQGYEQLPATGDYLVITKSNKDVMSLYGFDVPAIAPTSETVLIEEKRFIELQSRFLIIFTLFDRDRTGMTLSQQMRKKYNTIPLLFESNNKVFRMKEEPKDFTDHYKRYGSRYMLDLIEEIKQTI